MLASIGAISANAGERQWVRPGPDYRVDRIEARNYEARREADFLQAKRQLHNDLCREREGLANATAIQLSCGASPQDVADQTVIINQQLAAKYAAKQCELNNAYGVRYVAPVCR